MPINANREMIALALPATAVAATIHRQRLPLAAWRFSGRVAAKGRLEGPVVEFRILGPLEVVRDGESVVLGADAAASVAGCARASPQ